LSLGWERSAFVLGLGEKRVSAPVWNSYSYSHRAMGKDRAKGKEAGGAGSAAKGKGKGKPKGKGGRGDGERMYIDNIEELQKRQREDDEEDEEDEEDEVGEEGAERAEKVYILIVTCFSFIIFILYQGETVFAFEGKAKAEAQKGGEDDEMANMMGGMGIDNPNRRPVDDSNPEANMNRKQRLLHNVIASICLYLYVANIYLNS
jgi:hypothetical protein